MNMSNLIWILSILTFLGLSACQPGKETVVEKHYGELPAPQEQACDGGLCGGGGGNGIDKKTLEDLRREPKQLPAYELLKANVLDKLQGRFPALAADLYHVLEFRGWYFIPEALSVLPPTEIGVYFPTKQMALQNRRSIYLDDLIFSTMEVESQATLMLHEMVMGVQLLNYTGELDQCLLKFGMHRFDVTLKEQYLQERMDCYRKYKVPNDVADTIGVGKPLPNKLDYDTIRELTYTLLKNADTLDVEELKAWMDAHGVRHY
jgi:hypothetical protein